MNYWYVNQDVPVKPPDKYHWVSTGTASVNPCEHKNGWYVHVRFWIFTKKIFVCSDCGKSK
jgi:hypothetical protein